MERARGWLEGGDKVRATIAFRGREMTHRELGAAILKRLTEDLSDLADIEVHPKMEGYQMFTIFVPKKAKMAEKKPVEKAADKKADSEKTVEPAKKTVKKAPPKSKAEPKDDDEIF
jgi:translation initiation factor IF-3